MHGYRLETYTYDSVRTIFMDILHLPRSSLDDPSMRNTRDFRGTRTFFVIDGLGDFEGVSGYWAEEVETEMEGFLEEQEDVFWTFDEANET